MVEAILVSNIVTVAPDKPLPVEALLTVPLIFPVVVLVHWAYTVRLAVTAVVAVNSVPLPDLNVYLELL